MSVPIGSPESFALLASGSTVGVFQVESAGMSALCKRLRPSSLDEVAALIALYRPGPMELCDTFVKRKLGLEPVEYLHPAMEGILENTFGIMVFQEQIMQIVQEIAGLSLAQADILRRAIGKKKKEELDNAKSSFIVGCNEQGNGAIAEELWALIERFAAYGFNKSHAAAYAVLTLQTAHLKATSPVAFMVATMNAELGNAERLGELLLECRRLGIQVLPPMMMQYRCESWEICSCGMCPHRHPHYENEDCTGSGSCNKHPCRCLPVVDADLVIQELEERVEALTISYRVADIAALASSKKVTALTTKNEELREECKRLRDGWDTTREYLSDQILVNESLQEELEERVIALQVELGEWPQKMERLTTKLGAKIELLQLQGSQIEALKEECKRLRDGWCDEGLRHEGCQTILAAREETLSAIARLL
jgi:hypothetical protein